MMELTRQYDFLRRNERLPSRNKVYMRTVDAYRRHKSQSEDGSGPQSIGFDGITK